MDQSIPSTYTLPTDSSVRAEEAKPSTARIVQLFELVYGGELDSTALQMAVENRPIPEKNPDKWHGDGIRKTLAGSLSLTNKNHRERATAISRRVSRFMLESSAAYAALSTPDREFLQRVHQLTGSRSWEEEEHFGTKLMANASLVKKWGMDFSKTPSQQLKQKLTGKGMVQFKWTSCGHSEERRATSLNTAMNTAKAPQCWSCNRLDNSLITWHENNRLFLEDSGLDISRLTEEDLLDSAYAKRKFTVGYGCGHSEKTSFSSLKAKHKRAIEMGQEYITCNGCNVADGTFEVAIRMALQFSQSFIPGLVVEKQVELDELPRMPFDIRITTPQGIVYYIEIDGGYHYKGHSGSDEDKFLKKVEADRRKTKAVLLRGDRMIRVDERNHRGELLDELRGALFQAVYGTLPVYTVVGEECPGAAAVSDELKR
jgi:hypothetical protein